MSQTFSRGRTSNGSGGDSRNGTHGPLWLPNLGSPLFRHASGGLPTLPGLTCGLTYTVARGPSLVHDRDSPTLRRWEGVSSCSSHHGVFSFGFGSPPRGASVRGVSAIGGSLRFVDLRGASETGSASGLSIAVELFHCSLTSAR